MKKARTAAQNLAHELKSLAKNATAAENNPNDFCFLGRFFVILFIFRLAIFSFPVAVTAIRVERAVQEAHARLMH